MLEFVNRFKWTFAKTYAKTAPHEYLVLKEIDWKYEKTFKDVAKFINKEGLPSKFWGKTYIYYFLDGYKYWTMDEVIEETDLINREKI